MAGSLECGFGESESAGNGGMDSHGAVVVDDHSEAELAAGGLDCVASPWHGDAFGIVEPGRDCFRENSLAVELER